MAQNTAPTMSNGIGSPGKSSAVQSTGKIGNSQLAKRLQMELMNLMSDTDLMMSGISAFPEEDNLFRWVGTINGPEDSAYEGMQLKLQIEFPETYPYKAPNCLFKSGCWHPNVDMAGRICLDVLNERWSASMDVRGLLLSLQSLLDDPNPASPLNAEAATLWNENRKLYYEKVKAHFEKIEKLNAEKNN
jgi:ubiquitin-conjugating enzyme E2 C